MTLQRKPVTSPVEKRRVEMKKEFPLNMLTIVRHIVRHITLLNSLKIRNHCLMQINDTVKWGNFAMRPAV